MMTDIWYQFLTIYNWIIRNITRYPFFVPRVSYWTSFLKMTDFYEVSLWTFLDKVLRCPKTYNVISSTDMLSRGTLHQTICNYHIFPFPRGFLALYLNTGTRSLKKASIPWERDWPWLRPALAPAQINFVILFSHLINFKPFGSTNKKTNTWLKVRSCRGSFAGFF